MHPPEEGLPVVVLARAVVEEREEELAARTEQVPQARAMPDTPPPGTVAHSLMLHMDPAVLTVITEEGEAPAPAVTEAF